MNTHTHTHTAGERERLSGGNVVNRAPCFGSFGMVVLNRVPNRINFGINFGTSHMRANVIPAGAPQDCLRSLHTDKVDVWVGGCNLGQPLGMPW